jgi:site-specific DNA recombinase
VEAGKLLPGCRPRYGYRYRDADKAAYEIDPETGAIAARIWNEAARGRTLRQIAGGLSAEGIAKPSGRGRARWDHQTVRHILADLTYAGLAVGWRYRLVKGHGRQIRPEAEHVPLPEGTAPAIVDMATFEAVQERLRLNKERAARSNRAPEETLLRAGYVRCGQCGDAMMVQRPRPGRGMAAAYSCARGRKYRGDCTMHAISSSILDEAAWKRVEEIVTRPDVVLAELARLDDAGFSAEDIAAIDKRLAEIARQRRNLVDELADLGPTVRAVVREKLAALEAQQGQLEAERENIRARISAREAAKDRLVELEAWCRTVGANLAELTYEKKRLALDALGVRVRVWPKDHTPRYVIEMEPLPDSPVVSSTSR